MQIAETCQTSNHPVAPPLKLSNGPLFAGEGIIMGIGGFGYLAGLTSVGVGVMVVGLTLSAKLGLGVAVSQ